MVAASAAGTRIHHWVADVRELMEDHARGDDRERHLRPVPHRAQERRLAAELVDVRRPDDDDHPGDRRAVEHRDADHDRERQRELDVLPCRDRDQVDGRDAHDEEQRAPADRRPVDTDRPPAQP